MEFEEMRKIWDSQNNQTLYAIDERALSNHIRSKKDHARHITNLSEMVTIITNFASGIVLIIIMVMNEIDNFFMYLLSAWMFITSAVALTVRLRRIFSNVRFDRTMSGELDHALSLATYQVKFSQLMRWNLIPIVILTVLLVWSSGKSWWQVGGLLLLFGFAHFVSHFEHKFYKKKQQELERFKKKLEEN